MTSQHYILAVYDLCRSGKPDLLHSPTGFSKNPAFLNKKGLTRTSPDAKIRRADHKSEEDKGGFGRSSRMGGFSGGLVQNNQSCQMETFRRCSTDLEEQ
jgi:hypothetical protein